MPEVTAGAVAPVIPVAPAADAAPEIQSTADGIEETPEGEDKPEPADEPRLTQSEVNKIVAKRVAQAERNALKLARAEARAEVAERQLQEHRAPQEQPLKSGEPNVNDFKDYEEYLLAKAEYRYEQKQAAKQQQERTQTVEKQDRDFAVGLAQRLHEKFDAVADEIPDIIELVRGAVPFTEPMVTYIDESDLGAKVAHFLATNVKDAERIGKLGPASQIRELDKIEAKLAAPPKPTNSPAPIVPNKGTSSGIRSLSDLIGGSQEDFEKRRNDRIKAQRARR